MCAIVCQSPPREFDEGVEWMVPCRKLERLPEEKELVLTHILT